MAETMTFSTVQLVLAILGFAACVVAGLLTGATWLDRKRTAGDDRLHRRVDTVAAEAARAQAGVATVREEFVNKTDFQRHQDHVDSELRGLRSDIKGQFDRLNDRFDRLLAGARTTAGDS